MHTGVYRRITVFVLLGLIIGLGGIAMPHPARAQTAQITIANFSFQPSALTVPLGATVTWVNQDSVTHTSTSDTGVWDSGNLAHGQSFSFTFNQPGTFPYHCAIHPFMKASITVQTAATAVATSTSTSVPTVSATPTSMSSPTATGTVTSVATSTVPTATSIPLAAYPLYPGRGMAELHMGPIMSAQHIIWTGYYDGHKDIYLSTDVSNKGQAVAMHVNFAPALGRMPMAATPAIYLATGRAAGNQLAVFGSEPGESDYSPLWHEVIVQWKSGVKPVLLVQDNQIIDLAKKGKLTIRQTHVVLNCPIIKVGK